jgi:hypothetical protein
MRALYYLLAAAVLFYAVCQTAELAERLAARGRRASAAAGAPAAPALKPSEWRSAPADPSAETAARGKGVLIDKATGKRYQTP